MSATADQKIEPTEHGAIFFDTNGRELLVGLQVDEPILIAAIIEHSVSNRVVNRTFDHAREEITALREVDHGL